MSFSTYIDLDPEVRNHMDTISECRIEGCPVVQRHPYYSVPDEEPFYHGKRPCLPVVPTWLHRGRVMVLGMYPTCRFANVQKLNGGWAKEVPVRDIDEPFENARYFDTYNVRDVHSSTFLYKEYFEPLGLKREDLWITNTVKCFLFKEGHINAYKDIGWYDLLDSPVQESRTDYFDAAKPCFTRHLITEVELCRPKLVFTMGSAVCRMVHADADGNPADDGVFGIVRGRLLRANQNDSGTYERHDVFKDSNIFCFYHPAYLGRNENALKRHREEHIPRLRDFLAGFDL